MLTDSEMQEIIRSTSTHWSIKANMIRQFVDQNPDLLVEEFAWKLGLSSIQVTEFIILSSCLKKYPFCSRIPKKREVLNLIEKIKDPLELEHALILASARYKTQLEIQEIKEDAIEQFKDHLNEHNKRIKSARSTKRGKDQI